MGGKPRRTETLMFLTGVLFLILLGVSSGYAQPITGQLTEVTCPVIGGAQPELTPSKRQKTFPDPRSVQKLFICCYLVSVCVSLVSVCVPRISVCPLYQCVSLVPVCVSLVSVCVPCISARVSLVSVCVCPLYQCVSLVSVRVSPVFSVRVSLVSVCVCPLYQCVCVPCISVCVSHVLHAWFCSPTTPCIHTVSFDVREPEIGGGSDCWAKWTASC